MQIEDFEKELMGLQDQMTHVMKLNQEIGMASEHWERSFLELREESESHRSQQREEFKKKIGSKVEKIHQFKKKLVEKEKVLKNLQGDLVAATTYREDIQSRYQNMVSVGSMTDPVMELLEQHKSALETKLGQVKNDVTAVLDQVEQEQLDKGKLNEQLMQKDIKNRSQAAELTEAQDDVEQLRMKLQ